MKYSFALAAGAAGSALAQQTAYGQCGGENWTGATSCPSGWGCVYQNPYYSQCLPGADNAAATAAPAQQTAYGQCGGENWTGATSCPTGWGCVSQNPYYSQCLPGTGNAAPTTTLATSTTPAAAPTTLATSTTPAAAPTTLATSTTPAAATTSAAAPSSSAAAAAPSPAAGGKVKYAGVNIAGFDFGCGIDGTCTPSGAVNVAAEGLTQMTHFVSQTGLNAFRLPVGWQYLVNSVLGGTLDATNFGNYDQLVQNCLSSGAAMCIVDIHNYARWDGNIIGQSSVTNEDFTSLWSQLATHYASDSRVAFGIMNEPHDLPSVPTWAATVQAAVSAIRSAGATGNTILLPGDDFTSAAASISSGSYAALKGVTNPDGTTDGLIFDVHQYLDSDSSGTHSNCVTNNIASAFQPLATQLRSDGRQAMLTETGGGPTDSSCLQYLCQQLAFMAENSDVYLGWTGWAAGAFATSYVLSEVPSGDTDVPLVTQCIAGEFK